MKENILKMPSRNTLQLLFIGGGTGPADPAAAGPKLNRNPQFNFFAVKHTDSFNKQ